VRKRCFWCEGTKDVKMYEGHLACVFCRGEAQRYERVIPYLSPSIVAKKRNGKDFKDGYECRWCRKPKSEWIDKRKKFYCSNACREAFEKYHYFNFTWSGIRESVWKRDGKKCVKCGRVLSLNDAQIDHVVAIINGGDYFDKDNLQTLCKECHVRKTKQDIRKHRKLKLLDEKQAVLFVEKKRVIE